MNILVIDDTMSVLKVTKKLLSKLHFNGYTAMDGEGAIDVLNQINWDIAAAIVDVTIPGTDVPRLIVKIKERIPSVTIILASGYQYDVNDPTFNGIIFDEFLCKPFSISDLSAVLNKLLPEQTPL